MSCVQILNTRKKSAHCVELGILTSKISRDTVYVYAAKMFIRHARQLQYDGTVYHVETGLSDVWNFWERIL